MISCAISSDQIKKLYKHAYKSMKLKLNAEKPTAFDANEYMQNLFDEISKREDAETAAKFIQQVPRFINMLATTKFASKIGSVKGLTDVVIPAIQEFSSENALPGIIERFTKAKENTAKDIKDAAEQNKITENAVVLTEEPVSEKIAEPQRYKSFSVFSGTLNEFKKLKPGEKGVLTVEELDENRVELGDIISALSLEYSMQDSLTTPFTYQGKLIKVKATNLDEFVKRNPSAIDKATMDEVKTSRTLVKRGIAQEEVTQANERVLLVITDENGENIYFDKAGNITTKSEGRLVYQLMRDIRKTEDGYRVTDIYGREDQIAPVETVAKETYNEETDGKYEDYLDQLNKQREADLKQLFALKNKAVSEDVLLDFAGMSTGLPQSISGSRIPLSELPNFPEIKPNDIVIKTLTKTRNGIPKGRAIITLNGNDFLVERSQITEEIIQQLMDVLLSPTIPYELKKRFYNQFIPEDKDVKLSTSIRKHSIMPNDADKSFTVRLYSEVGLNPINQTRVQVLTNERLQKASKEALDQFRAQFETALRQGTKKNEPTYISYPSETKAQDFILYDRTNKEFVPGGYVEYLQTLNGEVVIANTDPGMFNRNMLYTVPASFSENVEKAQKESKANKKETPVSAKVIKDALVQRLNNGELITGTITRPPGSNTGYEFTEPNGNKAYFFNQYKKDPSVTQLDITSEDILEGAYLVLNPFIEADGKVFTDVVQVYDANDNLVGNVQETDFASDPKVEQIEKDIEIIKETEDPEIPVPQSPFDSLNFDSLKRSGYELDNVTKEELDAAEDFWNNTALGQDMQKYISPVTMFNIVNSNVNAEFFINAAALLNPEIKTLGSININPNKGTFVDIYHEAWHVFTQLYMTKQQKRDLYNEVKNFKDAKGKQPYANMSYFQIEEMLAEDFREYMKKANTKKGMPQRNSLFRRIVDFLKSLFGIKAKQNTINLATDVMAVPSVNELFTKLNLSNKHPELLNDYSASISNAMFFELNRGVRSVTNPTQSVLSDQDGKVVVDSMDMVVSEMIDDMYIYRKKQGQTTGLKSGALGMLLDPEKREFTFTYVKNKLQERLKEFKDQLEQQPDVVTINKINTLEQLENNAVAILKTKTGDDKYVLLSSQIDGFENLEPDIKKGDRVKGEDWHTIKIVGDFFKHKTIEKDGRKVGIIVVSRQSDALVQYDNYKKGGAETYTDIVLKKVPNYELTQDQEFILDNIRILQAALDNYGDPDYDVKDQAPEGMLAYYLENSDFEIGKTKYYIDVTDETDENGDEVDEFIQTEEGNSEILKDKLTGKKSMLQLAQKEVLYILKSLHKVEKDGTVPKNRLGFKEKADFRKIWNIVTKATGGIRNREVAYNKLLVEAEKFPEIKQLMEFKYPDPTKITNTFEQDISSSFWQTFSKPSAIYKQFTMFPQMGTVLNMITGQQEEVIVGYESEVTDSSLEIYGTVKKFEASFKGSLGTKYISKNLDNQSILDTQAVVKDFANRSGDGLDTKQAFEFLKSLGINLDDTKVIREDLSNRLDYYGPEFIYDVVAGFNTINNNKVSATQKQLEFLNNFKSNPIDVLVNEIPNGILPNFKGPVSEKTVINRLAELQVTYGYESANPGMLLPDGNLVYGTLNHSEVSVIANGINTIDTLSDFWENTEFQYMSGFNPSKNTFTLRSKVFATIYNTKDPKKVYTKKKGKGIEHLFVAGTKIGTDGTNTTDLDPIGKFMQEMNTTLLAGISEFMRMAEKKSSFGARVSGGIPKFISPIFNISKGDDANLWVDASMFRNPTNAKYTNGELFAIDNYFIDYIAVEFDRIRMFKQNKEEFKKIKGFNRVVGKNRSGADIYAGEVFTLFDNILRKSTQVDLYKLIQDPLIDLPSHLKTNTELRDKIIKDITDYFNETVSSLKENYLDKVPFQEKKLLSKLGYTQEQIDKNKDLIDSEDVQKELLKAYAYNDWIQKFEMMHLFVGDPAQFDHDKQDASKRAPGSTSDGDGFLSDKPFQNFVNDVFNKVTYASKESERTGKQLNTFKFDGTFNTGVIADAKRESVYLKDYQKAWEDYYRRLLSKKYKGEKLEKLIRDRIAKDSEPYEKMTESDGAGLITFDAYRLLKKAANAWSPQQESLYQDIISGNEVDANKIKQFFPVYKLHYYGDIANAPIAAKAMHKFALNPIIPTVAVKGTTLYDLHTKMMKDNIQYVVFGSGSKVSTLTNNTDGNFDNIFGNKDMTTVNQDAVITKNTIYLEYLKDVTKVADKLKNDISFPTQQRMIVLDSLFDAGDLRNTKNKSVVDNYDNAVSSYTDILEKELLNKIGYELKDGKYQGKLDKLVELIREELGAKEVPESLIKLLDTRTNGSLSMDFSIHPEADIIEKVIVNRIQKTVVKQKTKGEAMIQMPSTFYNGIWDTPYRVEKDPALRDKYLGSNNLPFYTQGEVINKKTGERAKTNLMKVAIPLNGDFRNILNVKHNDGEAIGTIDRLNEMIKDDNWLAENRELITITGPRIPTDKANVIVGAEVWHFLDAAMGNTVIVPSEIVAAAGSDFDVDKIFFMFPNITSKGELVKEVEGLDEKIAKINEAKKKNPKLKGPDSLIAQQKKYLQNKLIKDTVALLSLPENFALLTKPNATYLVEDHVKFFADKTKQYDEKKNKLGEDPKTNNGKIVMSPTRMNEIEHNLSVHDKNLTGGRPLGMFAKKNKTHVIYKSIGGKLPSKYKATVWDDVNKKYREVDTNYDMVLRLNHNKVKNSKGEEVISLSNELNVNGEKIGDILSHGLQGLLDRAKNPFPKTLNITTESTPVLLHLLETGIDVMDALAFINTPLAVEYFNTQKILGSSLGKLIESDLAKHQVKGKSASLVVKNAMKQMSAEDKNTVNEVIGQVNLKRLYDTIDNLKKEDKTKEYAFILKGSKEASKATLETITGNNNFPIGDIVELKEYNPKKLFANMTSLYKASNSLTNNDNYYYAAQALWKKAFGDVKTIDTDALKDVVADQDMSSLQGLALFLHLIQVEKQSKGMSDLEIMFSPDTGLLDTTLLVKKRDEAYKNFSEMTKVDDETLERLRYKSLLSSFYKSNLILDVVVPLFPLRLNESIQSFVSRKLKDNSDYITQKYGAGQKGQERFINAFNNGIVNYIFQNSMSNFSTPEGEVVELPETYHGIPVVKTEGQTTPVTLKNGQLLVDMEKAKADFKANVFLETTQGENSHKARGLDTFKASENPFWTFDSYIKYLTELEYLKSIYTPENLSEDKRYKRFVKQNNSEQLGYEKYLSEKALLDSFNNAFIMGTTKYSYTNMVMDTIKEFDSQNLKEKFPVLAQLSPVKNIKEVNVIELNNKADAKGSLAESYYKNLRQLADPSVRKVTYKDKKTEDADNKRITDVFENFSLMMFYQHGAGYSKFGFTKVLDPLNYIEVMQPAANGFLNNNLNDSVFQLVFDRMSIKSMFKNYVVKSEDYTDPKPMTPEELAERIAKANEAILAMGSIDTELGSNETNEEDPIEGPGEASPTQPTVQPVGPVSQTNKPKGVEVKEGIYVNQGALTKEEQLELFDYLKPFLEEQAAKTLKSNQASKMIGLGLRWDYKSNNTGRPAVNIPDVINPGNKNKYGYYNQSINGQPLGQITPRFKELMEKATGVDMTNYDGAIINLYEKDTFISSHNDVDESKSAIKYPVIGINLGGKGNFSIERLGPENAILNLEAGTGYVFGVDGINREVWHRTFPTPQDSFLPELTTKIDGKTYPAGSYRVTITMRRVMPLESGMPEAPSIISEQPLREEDFNLELKDRITILENKLANLEDTKRTLMETSVPVLIASNLPKIKPDSARRETGVKVGTAKDINPGMLSNNGVSVERAAEILNEDLFYEGSGFPEIDMQDIRNYIIDILQTGVKNFIDDYVGQDKIDNVKAEIEALREEQRLSKEGNTGIQLDLFSDENAPEGLPPIDRTSEECE